MKYLYQDSVELPVERDFILDLTDLLKLTVAVYPLENGIISANKEIERRSRVKALPKIGKFPDSKHSKAVSGCNLAR